MLLETATFRPISCEDELRRLYELNADDYGDAGISYNRLLARWNAFPSGILCIVHHREMLGAVGMWPMSVRAYRDFSAGGLTEHLIEPAKHFEKSDMGVRTWYISHIVLRKLYRGSGYV